MPSVSLLCRVGATGRLGKGLPHQPEFSAGQFFPVRRKRIDHQARTGSLSLLAGCLSRGHSKRWLSQRCAGNSMTR